MNKRLYLLLSFFLFLIYFFLRFYIRINTEFWFDEKEEIKTLISVDYLFSYLPTIIGGGGGAIPLHQLLVLPLYKIFGESKLALALPGLVSGAIFFLFIPQIINSLNIEGNFNKKVAILSSRLLLTFDPYLAFQSQEVRPYSLFPALWVLALFVINMLKSTKKINIIKDYWILILLVITFLWHLYSFVIYLSLSLYFIAAIKKIKKALLVKVMPVFVIVISVAAPVWLYFLKGSLGIRLNPFEFIPLPGKIFTRAEIAYFPYHRETYLVLGAVFLFLVLFTGFLSFIRDRKFFRQFLRMFLTLVFLPFLLIILVDLIKGYWILFRQVSWLFYIIYIIIGMCVGWLYNQRKNAF